MPPTVEYGPPPERGVTQLHYVGDDGVDAPGGGRLLWKLGWVLSGWVVGRSIFRRR